MSSGPTAVATPAVGHIAPPTKANVKLETFYKATL